MINKSKEEIPQHEIESLARCLLPEIQKFFESEEGKQEFALWKAEQEKMKAKHKTKSQSA